MRCRSVLAQCVALVGVVVATDTSAYLWTVDHQTTKHASNQVSTITSETANAIIARRRGVSASKYITTTDESILADINQFGGYQLPLFADSSSIPSKLFIRISGYDGSISQFDSLPDLWIEQPKRDLLEDFGARTNVEGMCEYDLTISFKEDVQIVYSYPQEGSSCMTKHEIEQSPEILALYSSVPTSKTAAGKGMVSFSRMLRHFAATSNIESTVLILPPASKLAKGSKKHQVPKRAATPQQQEEEPLDLPTDSSSLSSSSASFPKMGTSFVANSTLPKIIPECFASNGTCMDTTNACSGHGSCYLAHINCYKCRCGSTVVRRNADGTQKTVQWGGNACQKKDISTQFLLFAGVGIFLTTLIAGSMGMLYSMGSQELPSVIGAGVVGPRAQR